MDYSHFNTILARKAADAAYLLASICEWAPAGLMLRVVAIAESNEEPTIALTFAKSAKAECLNPCGTAACERIIREIESQRVCVN